MATMSVADQEDVWADLMSKLSSRREPIAVSKADLKAAVQAMDLFLSDNAAAVNNAFPAAAKAGLTTSQKAEVLAYVALKRYGGGV